VPRAPVDQPPTLAEASLDGARGGAAYVLVVGDDKMLTRPLPVDGELVLGRDPDCALPLLDARISRRHARLVVSRGEVRIEDIGSTNGIKLNGARLERGKPVRLPFGDSVRVGPFTLIVLANRGTPSDDGVRRAAVLVRDPSPAGKTELLERIARHGVGVLIHGETGTGKEVLARTIHTLSQRTGELLAINCAALTGTLLESELFGYEKGAFTGAMRAKPGLLEVAAQGTVLLDEIGDLPLELQGKLLRALEARQIYRVGGVQPIVLDARIVAASHRSLPDLIERGEFRQDLYFRLNGITLELLPLRERRAQIPALAQEFLREAAARAHDPPPPITPAALAVLAQYDWPGNVRELKLVIERAALLAGGSPIDERHILLEAHASAAHDEPDDSPADLREQFLEAARTHRGNASAIARALNTSRTQVRRLAIRFEVDLDQLRRG
jgi:two-component system, NtrC family, response regulator AtoC